MIVYENMHNEEQWDAGGIRGSMHYEIVNASHSGYAGAGTTLAYVNEKRTRREREENEKRTRRDVKREEDSMSA